MIRKSESSFLQGLLKSPDRTEALAWLEGGAGKNNLGELTVDDSLRVVRDLYKLGAVEVSVARIDEVDGFQSSDNMLIGMRDDPTSRAGIFNWFGDMAERMGLRAEVDEGQRYLLAWFD